MNTITRLKPGPMALSLFLSFGVLIGCTELTGSGDTGFQNQYVTARNALEEGNYDKAVRTYARLVEKAGPHEPRIRLEYAHALLRANSFQQAATQARILAASQTGAARGAALAVQGTAEHELALEGLRAGDTGNSKRLLASARTALTEMLSKSPELDPLGSMAMRKRSIDAQIANL